ncbi:TIGR03960 family B12-binding radical SAM protein [Desulfobacterium sp. N47]
MSGKQKRNKLPDTETGAVRKQWNDHIRIALVYPNTYKVGMSNLGFQTVYDILNGFDNILCERAFLPDDIISRILSIESSRSLLDFDIIAFSVSFESDFGNIISILKKAGLPVSASERGTPYPLVIAGGVACFINPEPVFEFIDCFVIGEAEAVLPNFLDHYKSGAEKKDNLLEIVKQVSGVYVPAFYETSYNKDGTLRSFYPIADVPEKIKYVYLKDISSVSTCSKIVSQNTTFDRSFLIEVSRGCPHGCRFCSAGFVYRPPRFRTLSSLEKTLDKGVAIADRIGFIGAAISDLPEIIALCSMAQIKGAQISFSSLRADALTGELAAALKKSGIKTATIAPDGGSQRIRNVINKGITEDQILSATEIIVDAGIPNIKLYFMIGLPTETMEDVEEIVILCKKIKKRFLDSSRKKQRIGHITISINPFIPKPFTPFQWAGMDDIASLKKKILHIKNGLKKEANVRIDFASPKKSYLQALISRGDRKMAGFLSLVESNSGNWLKTLKSSTINTDFYVYRKKSFDELLPWDFIDHGINKSYLEKEYQKALLFQTSAPCPMNSCKKCGVCIG